MNFAIIGCGAIGPRHAEHINKIGTLKAVCDIEQSRAENLGKKYNASVYYTIEDLLANEKEVDVVSVCTPNGLHAEHTIKALEAGFHVICEKPMANRLADCEEMIKTAEKCNKRIFVVKQNRYNPPVAAVKKAIDEGRLGKILSLQLNCFWNRNFEYYAKKDWYGSTDLDGGTLYTQFAHFIDLLYWLVGDVKKVHAFSKNFLHQDVIDYEDCGVAILEFNNNAIGAVNFTVNSHNKNMEGSLTIFGEKGTVKIGGQYLNELEYQSIQDFEITGLPPSNPPNQYGHYQGSMSNHAEVYNNVIGVLEKNQAVTTNSLEGLKTVEIINKIYSAAKKEQ